MRWREWYGRKTGNDPIIHANRFPAWEELTPDGRKQWKKENPMPKGDMLTPSTGLLCKLGSIVVHAEELLSPDGHAVDRTALNSLLADAEVVAWREQMDKAALLPVKRK